MVCHFCKSKRVRYQQFYICQPKNREQCPPLLSRDLDDKWNGHPMVVKVHYLKQRPFTWSQMPFVWTVVTLTLFQTPLLTEREARLASYSEMLVLNWTRKGQAGSRQRPCEGGAEAENRDGEDLVCVPQVSGQRWGQGSPVPPQHHQPLFQTQPRERPSQAPQL